MVGERKGRVNLYRGYGPHGRKSRLEKYRISWSGCCGDGHSGDAKKVREALTDIRETLESAERRLEHGGGDWKIVAVGSHDTGGVSPDDVGFVFQCSGHPTPTKKKERWYT